VVIRSCKSKDRQYNGKKIPKWLSEAVNQRTDNTMATRYQSGYQNLQIKGQSIQWPKDTKVVIRSCKSKDRQHNGYKIPKWLSKAVNQRTDNTMAKRYQNGYQKL
jgi:hypothetical protein